MGMGLMVMRFRYRQSSERHIMVDLGRAYMVIREGIIMVEPVRVCILVMIKSLHYQAISIPLSCDE